MYLQGTQAKMNSWTEYRLLPHHRCADGDHCMIIIIPASHLFSDLFFRTQCLQRGPNRIKRGVPDRHQGVDTPHLNCTAHDWSKTQS
jgi:hypothetical protein